MSYSGCQIGSIVSHWRRGLSAQVVHDGKCVAPERIVQLVADAGYAAELHSCRHPDAPPTSVARLRVRWDRPCA
jgi:hypothetical protein